MESIRDPTKPKPQLKPKPRKDAQKSEGRDPPEPQRKPPKLNCFNIYTATVQGLGFRVLFIGVCYRGYYSQTERRSPDRKAQQVSLSELTGSAGGNASGSPVLPSFSVAGLGLSGAFGV